MASFHGYTIVSSNTFQIDYNITITLTTKNYKLKSDSRLFEQRLSTTLHTQSLLRFRTDCRQQCKKLVYKQGKGRYSSSWEPHLRATGLHLPCGITQCYMPPDTSERAPPNPSHAGRYSIYLPQRDGRLS